MRPERGDGHDGSASLRDGLGARLAAASYVEQHRAACRLYVHAVRVRPHRRDRCDGPLSLHDRRRTRCATPRDSTERRTAMRLHVRLTRVRPQSCYGRRRAARLRYRLSTRWPACCETAQGRTAVNLHAHVLTEREANTGSADLQISGFQVRIAASHAQVRLQRRNYCRRAAHLRHQL